MTKSSEPGKTLALVGAWLQLGPLLGMAVTIIGMMRAFQTMGETGVKDPSAISAAVGQVLVSTFAGLFVGLIGAVMILLAVFRSGYRAEWVFWLLIILGCLYLPAFPVGTMIGTSFLITAFMRRTEFLRSAQTVKGRSD